MKINNDDGKVDGSVDSMTGKITMKDDLKFATNSTVEVNYTQNYLRLLSMDTSTSKGEDIRKLSYSGSRFFKLSY